MGFGGIFKFFFVGDCLSLPTLRRISFYIFRLNFFFLFPIRFFLCELVALPNRRGSRLPFNARRPAQDPTPASTTANCLPPAHFLSLFLLSLSPTNFSSIAPSFLSLFPPLSTRPSRFGTQEAARRGVQDGSLSVTSCFPPSLIQHTDTAPYLCVASLSTVPFLPRACCLPVKSIYVLGRVL